MQDVPSVKKVNAWPIMFILFRIPEQYYTIRMRALPACTGATLQKVPDRAFDRTGTHPVYPLPAIAITEQRKGKGTADCGPLEFFLRLLIFA